MTALILALLVGAQLPSLCALRTVDRSTTTSRTCVTCHDGTTAPGVSVSHDGTHPVGKLYPMGKLDLKPVPARGIVLVNGKVECTSCHDPKSNKYGYVAVPMNGSSLCLGCHVK